MLNRHAELEGILITQVFFSVFVIKHLIVYSLRMVKVDCFLYMVDRYFLSFHYKLN